MEEKNAHNLPTLTHILKNRASISTLNILEIYINDKLPLFKSPATQYLEDTYKKYMLIKP
jgi:hypothetical protein